MSGVKEDAEKHSPVEPKAEDENWWEILRIAWRSGFLLGTFLVGFLLGLLLGVWGVLELLDSIAMGLDLDSRELGRHPVVDFLFL